MSYTISSWDISIKDRRVFRQTVIEAMIAKALVNGLARNRAELVIRTLTPGDVGLKRWRTPPQRPNESTTWIKFEVPSTQVFGIFKLIQLSEKPKVTTLTFSVRFKIGSVVKAHHNFEHLYALLPVLDKIKEYKTEFTSQSIFGSVDQMVMEAYLSEPILYDGDDYLHLSVTSPEGNKNGDKLMLGGFVLEKNV